MAGSLSNNPQQLKDVILKRLGAPIINVEVTEEQVYDCIQQAVELFGEYHHDGLNRAFITIVGCNENGKEYTFDLSNYPVFAVTNVLRSEGTANFTMDGTTTYAWVNDFLNGLTGSVGSSQVNYYSPFSGQGDMTTYSLLMSYTKLIQDMLNPVPNWAFDNGNKLFNVADGLAFGEVLVLEVYIMSHVAMTDGELAVGNEGLAVTDTISTANEQYNNPYNKLNDIGVGTTTELDQGNVYNNRWVKDYAAECVKMLNGTILSKNQGMQLAGGVTVDGQTMKQEAQEQIDRLREELYTLQAPSPVIMG